MVVRRQALSRLAAVSPDAFYNSGKSVRKKLPPKQRESWKAVTEVADLQSCSC